VTIVTKRTNTRHAFFCVKHENLNGISYSYEQVPGGRVVLVQPLHI